ncbi:MAG: DUF1987 domain-containing protein [Sphingobacteriaceae bacterium]|nr:DUF1987 domain-containing protein [Sphingobacteriaceae bacterium]
MENYSLEASPKTPEIKFDLKQGSLQIKGWSVPENALEFYIPLMDALDKYADIAKPTTKVNIELEYFNTSTSKSIMGVLKKLERIHNGGSEVTVNWHYDKDDEDMLQAMEDYKQVVNIPIQGIVIPDKN